MNQSVIIEMTLAALAAQGVLSLKDAERLSANLKAQYSGWPLDDIKLRDVYSYLKPICDASKDGDAIPSDHSN